MVEDNICINLNSRGVSLGNRFQILGFDSVLGAHSPFLVELAEIVKIIDAVSHIV